MGTDLEIQNYYGELTKGQTRAPVPNFDRILLSPRSTSAISARYGGLQDPGKGSRHPELQEEIQRSRTTGATTEIQNYRGPATGEPTRRRTTVPVPNFEGISLSPQSTSPDHQVDNHSSKPMGPEQIHKHSFHLHLSSKLGLIAAQW
jgi:hypothetical protein